jgi:hypothetical protein
VDFLIKITVCIALAGVLSIYWGIRKLGEVVEASNNPQTIALQQLLDRGPKGNHHLSITDYQHDDSFVTETTKNDPIPTGYIPLTVKDGDGRVVVLKTSGFRLQFGGIKNDPIKGMVLDDPVPPQVVTKLKDKYPKLDLDHALLFDEGATPTTPSVGWSFIGLGVALFLPLALCIVLSVAKDRRERERARVLYEAGMLPGPPPSRRPAPLEEPAGATEQGSVPPLSTSVAAQVSLPLSPAESAARENAPTDSETVQETLQRIRSAVNQLESPKPIPLTRGRLITHLAIGGALTIAAGVGSWFVGGDTLWKVGNWVFGIAIVILLVLIRTRRRQRVDDWLIFAGIGSAMVVWIAIGFWFPLTTVKIDPENIGSRSRVTYNGKLMIEWPSNEPASFTMRGPLNRAKMKIETLGPTGWFPRKYTAASDNSVGLGEVETATLFIDNRDHAAVTLSYGELEFQVAANKAEKRTVLASRFGEAVSLRIDGKEAGSLDHTTVLIDILGTRSYRLREVVYGGEMQRLGVFGDRNQPEPRVSVLSGQHVYRLPMPPDYFLEHAPAKISITTMKGLEGFARESRFELVVDH